MKSDSNWTAGLRTVAPRWAKALIRRALTRTQLSQAPRHENAFATHLPVLTGLGLTLPIQTVLELGAGTLSTLHFLDKRIFPRVASVVSYENDFQWYQTVRDKVSDPRLDLRFIPHEMYKVIDNLSLSEFSLIFVDDSKSLEQRTQTIRQLAGHQKYIKGIVAIHDFEQQAYRDAASPFPYVKRFRAFNPEVGLVWSQTDLNPSIFQAIDKVIRHNSRKTSPDDIDAWIQVFQEHLR